MSVPFHFKASITEGEERAYAELRKAYFQAMDIGTSVTEGITMWERFRRRKHDDKHERIYEFVFASGQKMQRLVANVQRTDKLPIKTKPKIESTWGALLDMCTIGLAFEAGRQNPDQVTTLDQMVVMNKPTTTDELEELVETYGTEVDKKAYEENEELFFAVMMRTAVYMTNQLFLVNPQVRMYYNEGRKRESDNVQREMRIDLIIMEELGGMPGAQDGDRRQAERTDSLREEMAEMTRKLDDIRKRAREAGVELLAEPSAKRSRKAEAE